MVDDLVEKVIGAGVIGAGGAGFPAHIKLDCKVDTVIANGAECEPLLYSDQQIMHKNADEVVAGLHLVMKQVKAKKGFIALKAKYKASLQAIKKVAAKYDDIEIALLEDYYPVGDEQILAYEVTSRLTPQGGIPIDIGVLVCNVQSLVQIHSAANGTHVTSRMVTIIGDIPRPAVIEVAIGTTFEELLAGTGNQLDDDGKVILEGGIMMGTVRENLDEPVKRTTTGIIVLPKAHPVVMEKLRHWQRDINIMRSACAQCYYCSEVCSRRLLGLELEPHKIMHYIALGDERHIPEGIYNCSGCGLCGIWACYMGLSPWKVIQYLKQKIPYDGHKIPIDAAHPSRNLRKVPSSRLKIRLGIDKFDIKPTVLEPLLEPKRVRLSLEEHIGAAAVPLVSIGDMVRKGDIIAEPPAGEMGAVVIASITGKVTKINDCIEIINQE